MMREDLRGEEIIMESKYLVEDIEILQKEVKLRENIETIKKTVLISNLKRLKYY
jgi:hypothetical protein